MFLRREKVAILVAKNSEGTLSNFKRAEEDKLDISRLNKPQMADVVT